MNQTTREQYGTMRQMPNILMCMNVVQLTCILANLGVKVIIENQRVSWFQVFNPSDIHLPFLDSLTTGIPYIVKSY